MIACPRLLSKGDPAFTIREEGHGSEESNSKLMRRTYVEYPKKLENEKG